MSPTRTPEGGEAAAARHVELKCWPGPFEAVCRGRKPFEVRPDDRGLAEGDTFTLLEWDIVEGCFTGHRVGPFVITYLLRGRPLPDGYCAFAFEKSRDTAPAAPSPEPTCLDCDRPWGEPHAEGCPFAAQAPGLRVGEVSPEPHRCPSCDMSDGLPSGNLISATPVRTAPRPEPVAGAREAAHAVTPSCPVNDRNEQDITHSAHCDRVTAAIEARDEAHAAETARLRVALTKASHALRITGEWLKDHSGLDAIRGVKGTVAGILEDARIAALAAEGLAQPETKGTR